MRINVEGLKSLIRECMKEINEGCGDYRAPASFSSPDKHHPRNLDDIPDEDLSKGMWKSFVDEALGPDDRFRREYVLRALGDNPKILEMLLDGVAEDPELQEEMYKAIDDLRKNK